MRLIAISLAFLKWESPFLLWFSSSSSSSPLFGDCLKVSWSVVVLLYFLYCKWFFLFPKFLIISSYCCLSCSAAFLLSFSIFICMIVLLSLLKWLELSLTVVDSEGLNIVSLYVWLIRGSESPFTLLLLRYPSCSNIKPVLLAFRVFKL